MKQKNNMKNGKIKYFIAYNTNLKEKISIYIGKYIQFHSNFVKKKNTKRKPQNNFLQFEQNC